MAFEILQRCPSCDTRTPLYLVTEERPTTHDLFSYRCPHCHNTIAFTAEVNGTSVDIPESAILAKRWRPSMVVAGNSEERRSTFGAYSNF